MTDWPFGRKILMIFSALAALAFAIAIISILSLQSIIREKDTIISHDVQELLLANELSRLHEARVSDTRAFIITRRREFLQAQGRAIKEFTQKLGKLETPNIPPDVHHLLEKIRTINSEYDSLVKKAVRSPQNANWALDNVVRPRRIQLELALADLNQRLATQLQRSVKASADKAHGAITEMLIIAFGMLLLLLGLGWTLLEVVRQEQKTLSESESARETLHAAEKRAAFLAQTSKILSESADPRAALAEIGKLSMGWLSDICLIELSEDSGPLRPIALTISALAQRELLESLHHQLPHGLGSLFHTEQLLQGGEPTLSRKSVDARIRSLGVTSYLAVPLRARGRTLGVLFLARTENAPLYSDQDLKFVEELSHQTALTIDNMRLLQQAEVGLKMREELLATVAHDLRNPLTAIRMNSELILHAPTHGEASALPLRLGASALPAAKLGQSIYESAQEMERLIHDLLDLSKLESGKINLDRQPNDAEGLISACLKLLSPQASAKSIELIKDVKSGECIVDCDRNRILQVLSNLVGNALKFTEKGGRIRVEAQPTGEGIRFSVIDNGPGIAAEQLPHVFERYWQSRRTGTGSSGLGLSIARGIVEAHGGRIWAESALHIGSRFFFTLPEARRKLKGTPKAA
jgi:signal transduction histidine kinase/CHASE3 domain sensor protein